MWNLLLVHDQCDLCDVWGFVFNLGKQKSILCLLPDTPSSACLLFSYILMKFKCWLIDVIVNANVNFNSNLNLMDI